MHTVKVQTAQNVDIEYEVANVGERILAAMIDYLIIFGYFFGLLILILVVIQPDDDVMGLWVILGLILYLPLMFYDLICEFFMGGQSFGKKIMRIKVVKLDGSQATIGSYLLRWMLRLIDVTLMTGSIAVITILINGKGQRIGDLAAGTTVVKLKERVTLEDTIFVQLDDNYKPLFLEAENLEDKTIAVIREVLDFDRQNRKSKSNDLILNKTKKTLEEKMRIKSNLPHREFLQTVLSDYNFLNGKLQ